MDYLSAAKSLACFLAAFSWLKAWRSPAGENFSFAAFITALCFILEGFRIALAIIDRAT
jgi:prepilin signal peptidase PulO-like enzyme (type II secretory pathway)